MNVKLALLVIFVPAVVTVCHHNRQHKLTQMVCSNFQINGQQWKSHLTSNSDWEKLTFKNVTGFLELSDISMPHLKYLSVVHSHINNITLGDFPNLIFFMIWKNSNFPNLTRDFFNQTDINWLSLVSNNHTIESNAFHLLQNLSWLHIQNQNFNHLSRDYLKENSKLHELSIRNCHLEHIDVDAFVDNPDLEILSMNFNKIRFFQIGTFRNLKNLKILELHHNKFVDFNLEQFRGTIAVEVLGLPSNFLRNISDISSLLTSFPNLKKMEIKKKDLVAKDGVKLIVRELRRRGIDIIGTPHDCHHSITCKIF